MARRFVATVAATAGGFSYSPAFVVNQWADPCNIAVGVAVQHGKTSAIYTVEHTFEDPFSVNLSDPANTAYWWPNSTIVSAFTTVADTNYIVPPNAIRLKLYAAASAQVVMYINQAGAT